MDRAPGFGELAEEATRGDLRRILAVQGIRAFLYGLGTVLIGSSLATRGLSDFRVGLVFTAMLAGMALVSIAVGLRGDRVGRRRLYAALLGLMGVAGAVFASTAWLPALVLVALTGTMSTDANESGPITSIEQAMIGHAPAEDRVHVFGRYNALAYLTGSLGALVAGGVAAFHRALPSSPPNERWLLLFPLGSLACLLVAHRLGDGVEAPRPEPRKGGGAAEPGLGGDSPAERPPARPPLGRSSGAVTKLATLFALDSFAGGFVVGTFIVFWFSRNFGASPQMMSLVVFGAGLLQAASSVVAAKLGARFGLLNVMVFTHLPSNVLLLLVPFAPSLGLAITFLLCRFALSQMDVPTRQAYVVAMVDPGERTAAAALTNTARYVSRPFGALFAGATMAVATAVPFAAAGGLKIVYDLLLYATFRRVKPPSGPGSSSALPPSR